MHTLFVIQQAVTDSVATNIGNEIGAQATALILAGLGVVTTLATNVGKAVLKVFGTLPDWSKALLALAFSQLAMFGSKALGVDISTDITALSTTLSGLVVWGTSMGWHSLSKLFKKKTA